MGMNHTYHTWETFPCHFAQFLNSTDPQTQQILLYTSKTASGLEFMDNPTTRWRSAKMTGWVANPTEYQIGFDTLFDPFSRANAIADAICPSVLCSKCFMFLFLVFTIHFLGPRLSNVGAMASRAATDLPYFCLLQLRGLRALWQQHVDVGGSMMTSAILAGVMLISDYSEVPRLNESSHKRTKEDERSDMMWIWMLYLEQQITWNTHRFMVVLVRVRGSLFAKSLSGTLWESQCFFCIFMRFMHFR